MAKSRKRQDPVSSVDSGNEHDAAGNGHGSGNGDSRDRIALRAYELYLARGGADGGDFDDWIAAERELTTSSTETGSDRDE